MVKLNTRNTQLQPNLEKTKPAVLAELVFHGSVSQAPNIFDFVPGAALEGIADDFQPL